MLWFKKQTKPTIEDQEYFVHNTSVEVVAHKDAKAEVVRQAHQVNADLNKLLLGNGFTLKIYIAAGGKPPKTQRKAM